MEPRQAAIGEVVGKLALPTAEKATQMAEAPQLRPPDPRNIKSFIPDKKPHPELNPAFIECISLRYAPAQ